ncbi:mothers against decapentaplegic homolog 6 [Anoplophora glabripennis]|nr:mothers against decapentaplegic homolog 6 [Anoplophora glabripennis]
MAPAIPTTGLDRSHSGGPTHKQLRARENASQSCGRHSRNEPAISAASTCRSDRHQKLVIVQWLCGEEVKVCARRPIVAPKCLPCAEGKSSLMFMFRSKKANLTKRLVKARKRRGNETRRTAEEETDSISTLLKKLQENQLEMLLRAIDTTGKDLTNCVLLPQAFGEEPHVLCCQTWRWPDLRQGSELRRLPMCRSASDPVYICCNPYHWSRLCQPETPPPPYSRTNVDRLKPEDRAPSEAPLVCRDSYPGSLTTNGDSCMNPQVWCKLAYWELSQRVGPPFPVEPTAVNVFGDDPYGDGLNLETLAQHSFSPPESVQQARRKIGLGVTLSHEENCVWVYNRSENSIFVSSLTLEDPDSPSPTKVPAGNCLCIFDPVKAAQQNYGWNFTHPQFGPIDPNSVRISFVKGWGQKYSRREIMSCPCWLEILLAPCR